ncbi:MAG: phage protein GemA/Gp16 family protein [Thermodesulfobacteriota bacterium]
MTFHLLFLLDLGYNVFVPIGKKKKALVHIAKEDLHLSEESYRQILKAVAGVESSTKLTREGFEKVMKRFEEMGFKGLLPRPYHPTPKSRLIPPGSPQGQQSITSSQQDFLTYLLGELGWAEAQYQGFCRRIIKKPYPLTRREGQKIIIGLMAILRKRALSSKRKGLPSPRPNLTGNQVSLHP